MKTIKIPIKLPKNFVPPENMLLKQVFIPIEPIWVVAGKTYEFVVVEEQPDEPA